ncbi:MAG: hypothetical protein HQ556_15980 [Candidatus Marinimicrobia bacterium]|nr:hypothetical protein [Candidatus Neomarinimicrobiota bacterium]
MVSLKEDLQRRLTTFDEFKSLTLRVLDYLGAVVSEKSVHGEYTLMSSTIAGTTKQIRPYCTSLFLDDQKMFLQSFAEFMKILNWLRSNKSYNLNFQPKTIDAVLYTIQQSIGMGMDLSVEPNSSRKHVGNRFEELIKTLFDEIGVAAKKVVLNIPYKTEEGKKHYKCEIDLVISPHEEVISNSSNLHIDETVITLKTTTKDRMPKIFIDKILMERFVGHQVKVVGISLNDIQRKQMDKVSSTFVSNLFMVYTEFLTELEGYYYLDMPKRALESPFSNHIQNFSTFLITDLWELLHP